MFCGAHRWIAQEVHIQRLFVSKDLSGMDVHPLRAALKKRYAVPVEVLPHNAEIGGLIDGIQTEMRREMRLRRGTP